MSEWKKIEAEELNKNVFHLIGKEWMLVTAEKEGKVNTMTASWGGVGIMWGKPVAYVVIRPQRYTKEFIDGSEGFSLTFMDESYRKELKYLGSTSGRDENKMEKSGLTVEKKEKIPYISQGNLVLICKKLFVQSLEEQSFVAKELIEKWYPKKDYHTLYIVEIEEMLTK